MEGAPGIMVSMATKPAAQISAGPEIQRTVSVAEKSPEIKPQISNSDDKSKLTSSHDRMEQPEKKRDRQKETTREQAHQEQEETQSSEAGSLTPEEQKKQKILEQIEKFRDKKLSKKQLAEIEEYLREILGENEEEESHSKLIDSLAELTRFLFLLMQLFVLLAENKASYTGEDLLSSLSKTPPEGDDNEVLTRIVYGESNKDSWKKFRDGVTNLKEPMPFDRFMSAVLELNAKNAVREVKVEEKSKKDGTAAFKQLKTIMQARSAAKR